MTLIGKIAAALDKIFTPYACTAEAANTRAELAYLRDRRCYVLRLAAHLEESADSEQREPEIEP